jgi:hypothetical protein
MVRGAFPSVVLAVNSAFGGEEAAETTPGKSIIKIANPISRPMVRDLVKGPDDFIINQSFRSIIYSPTTAGSMIEPVSYMNEHQWISTLSYLFDRFFDFERVSVRTILY